MEICLNSDSAMSRQRVMYSMALTSSELPAVTRDLHVRSLVFVLIERRNNPIITMMERSKF
jgi:hypothetical protein